MSNHFKKLLIGIAAVAAFAPAAFPQFAATGTTTLSVTVGAEAAISVTTATTTLTAGAGAFADFTGSTTFTYKIRTTKVGGTGSITAQVTSDFAAGGPSVGSPLPGDTMTFACTVVAPGTSCAGTPAASTSAVSVATFGANAKSAKAGNAGNSLAWTLPNDPAYETGTYTAVVTFSISAT
jgi:hypothetical protein